MKFQSFFRLLAAAGLSLVTSKDLHTKKIHGDTLWDTKSVVDEGTRQKVFLERHGEWPDPKWLAEEHPGYSARMEEVKKF